MSIKSRNRCAARLSSTLSLSLGSKLKMRPFAVGIAECTVHNNVMKLPKWPLLTLVVYFLLSREMRETEIMVYRKSLFIL